MSPITYPNVNEWYELANGEIFRVVEVGADSIDIQYPDGALERVEMAIWHKLGAEPTELPEEWLEVQEEEVQELDFFNLGVAPGTEGADYLDLYSDYFDNE